MNALKPLARLSVGHSSNAFRCLGHASRDSFLLTRHLLSSATFAVLRRKNESPYESSETKFFEDDDEEPKSDGSEKRTQKEVLAITEAEIVEATGRRIVPLANDDMDVPVAMKPEVLNDLRHYSKLGSLMQQRSEVLDSGGAPGLTGFSESTAKEHALKNAVCTEREQEDSESTRDDGEAETGTRDQGNQG